MTQTTHWLAMRNPTTRSRKLVGVYAAGLALGMTGIQDPKSGYQYSFFVLTETPLMRNPVGT